jgi:hypothetical protein
VVDWTWRDSNSAFIRGKAAAKLILAFRSIYNLFDHMNIMTAAIRGHQIQMTCLFTQVYGERNTGATYLGKLINKIFSTDSLCGNFGVDKRVIRIVLQTYKPKERPFHNNRMQDEYHERILYSDFVRNTQPRRLI